VPLAMQLFDVLKKQQLPSRRDGRRFEASFGHGAELKDGVLSLVLPRSGKLNLTTQVR
jgi:hypothetical protein